LILFLCATSSRRLLLCRHSIVALNQHTRAQWHTFFTPVTSGRNVLEHGLCPVYNGRAAAVP
jgi:hypothetical protein